MQSTMTAVLAVLCVFSIIASVSQSQLLCEDGYSCYEDPVRNVVWVKKDDGNIHGPTCQDVCQDALLNNAGVFHTCDPAQPFIHDIGSLSDISSALNFTCQTGSCWDGLANFVMFTDGDVYHKNCYFPSQTDETQYFPCHSVPGNVNCFNERYSILCPCVAKALDEACDWEDLDGGAHVPSTAVWGDPNGTSCIDRINYWRERACEENWIECPPSGLPPMTECTCCHACANSQSQFDKSNGAHASFKRCGDRSQGQGGGSTCQNVIDAFVSERAPDENGTYRCQGHCGPIVGRGCQTFFWGEYEGFYTLNWGTCDVDKCTQYCTDPSTTACAESSSNDMAPDVSSCPAWRIDEENNVVGTVAAGVFAGIPICLLLVGCLLLLFAKLKKPQSNTEKVQTRTKSTAKPKKKTATVQYKKASQK